MTETIEQDNHECGSTLRTVWSRMCIDIASQADYECALNVDRDDRSGWLLMWINMTDQIDQECWSKVIETTDQTNHECASILRVKPITNVHWMWTEMVDRPDHEWDRRWLRHLIRLIMNVDRYWWSSLSGMWIEDDWDNRWGQYRMWIDITDQIDHKCGSHVDRYSW